VIPALGEQNGRASRRQGREDVLENTPVARLVARESAVDGLDADIAGVPRHPERGLAHDELVAERPPRGLALGIDPIAHRTQLHFDDRVVAVAPLGRGRQAHDEASLDFRIADSLGR